MGEERELDTLRIRLAQFHDWKRHVPLGFPSRSHPWLLDKQQESILQNLLVTLGCKNSDRIRFANLLYWISGDAAVESFLNSTRTLNDETAEVEARRAYQTSLARIGIWLKRIRTESNSIIHQELKAWIRDLSPCLVRRAKLSSRLGQKCLSIHLEELHAKCQKALQECRGGRRHQLLSTIASITLSSNEKEALPELPASVFEISGRS